MMHRKAYGFPRWNPREAVCRTRVPRIPIAVCTLIALMFVCLFVCLFVCFIQNSETTKLLRRNLRRINIIYMCVALSHFILC